ncbi:MAG: 4'-phosphopantetheinyl transferase superfamily protein [Deltaproteobacteria bacterium]|nr:4'-phosphopantetheinyl transferase superfamily protein [Deltaproteobacteria bacterium]MBW2131355.1 4'-phosphopantetheinyl transferase superfamily protein [Deltaproteobacteria bacterium]
MKKPCVSKMAFEDRLYPVLLPVPEAYQHRRRAETVRFLKAHARRALALSARKSGVALENLEKKENGAPVPSRGVHWSLTHKDAFVGAVAAPEPVGIDLETIRPRSTALFARIADDREWALLGTKDPRCFFRCWTAKEAVLKAAGDGLSGLSGCRIHDVFNENRLTVIYKGTPWKVEHHFFKGHVASITLGSLPVEWVLVEDAFFEPDVFLQDTHLPFKSSQTRG